MMTLKDLNIFKMEASGHQLPLPMLVASRIGLLIRDHTLAPGTRLPSEPELAGAMQVSRSTLRAAMASLQQDGLVVRRRGIGTFVSPTPFIANRLGVNTGLTDLIRSLGLVPACAEISVAACPTTPALAQTLGAGAETQVLEVQRVRSADGKRVSFSKDWLPITVLELSQPCMTPEELERLLAREISLYSVLERDMGVRIHHGSAELSPILAGAVLAKKLQVPARSPLMRIRETHFDTSGSAAMVSDECFAPDFATFVVYRRGPHAV